MNYTTVRFPGTGFISQQFSEEELLPIKTEILEILENPESGIKYNDQLIGHIKHEYDLIKSKKYLNDLLLPFVQEYDRQFNYIHTVNILTDNLPITLSNVWVNFQKKHEFNPIHNHSGVLSFVIWIKIPYQREQENLISPGKDSIYDLAGKFTFHYYNMLGDIASFDMDENIFKENTMILFPSKLNHSVFPFYSSDEYRISISGNFRFQV